MDPEQELLFLRAQVAMLQETANSAETALRACEAQIERLEKELELYKNDPFGREDPPESYEEAINRLP